MMWLEKCQKMTISEDYDVKGVDRGRLECLNAASMPTRGLNGGLSERLVQQGKPTAAQHERFC